MIRVTITGYYLCDNEMVNISSRSVWRLFVYLSNVVVVVTYFQI